jgi:hypothetical protein
MAKSEKAVPARQIQSATWRVRIGSLRATMKMRSTAVANLALGAGAAMVFAGISLLVATVTEARRRR